MKSAHFTNSRQKRQGVFYESMGISRSKSYQIVRQLNKELKAQGYLTVAGKCPIQYFKQKFYGFQIPGGERDVG